jgi:hypothetical protein
MRQGRRIDTIPILLVSSIFGFFIFSAIIWNAFLCTAPFECLDTYKQK